MYSRILVAVDDSEVSKVALQTAIQFAQDQQAILRIVYVSVEVFVGEIFPLDPKKYAASVKKHDQYLLRKIKSLASKAYNKVESHLVKITDPYENISEKIIAEAEKWHAELIVLGTHGRSGLSRLMLGSVTEEVLRGTSIPVHVVQDNKEGK